MCHGCPERSWREAPGEALGFWSARGRLREKTDIERDAADLVVRDLGAVKAECRDTGGGEQIRDFDVVFDDGHEEPLEITLDAQDAVIQSWDRLDRENELDADLKRHWSASPGFYDGDGRGKVVDVRQVRAVLIPFLQELRHEHEPPRRARHHVPGRGGSRHE